jgi:hypothetical protein
MPKTKIEAKKVLDDIKAGLDDAALMEKYNLSIKGLHSVLEKLVALKALNDSYIWTGRPPRETGPASPNRELSAKEVTKDIKSGMTDGDLMRKYKLSAKGLQNLLEQLMEAGAIKESDLEQGKPMMESTVELTSDMLPPFADTVVGPKVALDPPPAATEPSPPGVAPPLEKPQEVQIVASAEPAFPSTIPITAVADTGPEAVASVPPAPEGGPQDTVKQGPQELPQEHPVKDLWATTAPKSASTDEKPVDRPAEVEAPLTSTGAPQQESPPPDYEQTIELVWKCPACGQPQTHAYDECPICGIVVSKFAGHLRKGIESDTISDRHKPEPKAPALPPPAVEPPAPEPPVPTALKPRQVPTAPRSEPAIKPRPQPQRPSVVHEEVDQPEHDSSGYLSGILTFMAIAQFVVVVLYAGVRLYLERYQLFSLTFLAWSVAVPVLASSTVCALLYAAAVLVKLGRENVSAIARSNRLLGEMLAKMDKHGT